MFCPNCGSKLKNEINEIEVTQEVATNLVSNEVSIDNLVESASKEDVIGVCPHCGYAIPKHLNETEVKKLNQIAHNKFHSARNKWNTGMCGIVGGAILFAIAAIFFILCFKVAENYRFSTEGEPFIVFVALSALSVFLFVFGGVYIGIANKNKKIYSNVIKDIGNKTFIQ